MPDYNYPILFPTYTIDIIYHWSKDACSKLPFQYILVFYRIFSDRDTNLLKSNKLVHYLPHHKQSIETKTSLPMHSFPFSHNYSPTGSSKNLTITNHSEVKPTDRHPDDTSKPHHNLL